MIGSVAVRIYFHHLLFQISGLVAADLVEECKLGQMAVHVVRVLMGNHEAELNSK